MRFEPPALKHPFRDCQILSHTSLQYMPYRVYCHIAIYIPKKILTLSLNISNPVLKKAHGPIENASYAFMFFPSANACLAAWKPGVGIFSLIMCMAHKEKFWMVGTLSR